MFVKWRRNVRMLQELLMNIETLTVSQLKNLNVRKQKNREEIQSQEPQCNK